MLLSAPPYLQDGLRHPSFAVFNVVPLLPRDLVVLTILPGTDTAHARGLVSCCILASAEVGAK